MRKASISVKDFEQNLSLRRHAGKSKEVARALDAQADQLPYAKNFSADEFKHFLSQLTPKRFELLQLATQGQHSITDLANALSRDPSAVSKDVACLSQLGLVRVDDVCNHGHGRKKIVIPVASKISIRAALTVL